MRKTNKKETEKPEEDFWQVDYLDSHSVCDVCEELSFIWLWCLLRYKTESDSLIAMAPSPSSWDWADLANLTSVGTRFLHPRQTIQYTAAAEITDWEDKHAICYFITSFYVLRK